MANGRFTLGKQSGGTLGLVFPDGVSNTEVVLPESGELVTKDYADLKVALADFTGANVSLATNGYQKLPGGLIIQWGSVTVPVDSSATFTFPIAFPNACLVAFAQQTIGIAGGGTSIPGWVVTGKTLTGMTVLNDYATQTFYVFAIGY